MQSIHIALIKGEKVIMVLVKKIKLTKSPKQAKKIPFTGNTKDLLNRNYEQLHQNM